MFRLHIVTFRHLKNKTMGRAQGKVPFVQANLFKRPLVKKLQMKIRLLCPQSLAYTIVTTLPQSLLRCAHILDR